MVAVILKILKIIGIVLLSLLGTALFLALLVLLLPLRYKISAENRKDSPLKADFKLTYFFRVLRAYAHYEKDVSVSVKVLWFTLFEFKYPSDKNEEESGTIFEFDDEDADGILDEDFSGADQDHITDTEDEMADSGDFLNENADHVSLKDSEENSGNDPDGNAAENEGLDSDEEREVSSEDVSSEEDAPDDEENDFSESDDIFTKLKYKVREICDKIDKVRSEYRYYHNVLNSNEAAYAYRNFKKRLFRILKKVLPRKVHAGVIYGFDSPDLTGKVYGLYCIFRNRFDKSSHVTPDFDKAVFEGEVYAKGHFNLWCIVYNVLCVALHPGSIKIYRSVRRHRKKKSDAETAGREDAA